MNLNISLTVISKYVVGVKLKKHKHYQCSEGNFTQALEVGISINQIQQ